MGEERIEALRSLGAWVEEVMRLAIPSLPGSCSRAGTCILKCSTS